LVFRLRGPAPGDGPAIVVCHAASTVHPSKSKYKRETQYR
jgi:hypothetical protein